MQFIEVETMLRSWMKFIVFPAILLSSCYSDSIRIKENISKSCYNPDHTQVAFLKFISVYRPPKGITKFPDGGTPKYLFKNTSLYRYNLTDSLLQKVYDFGGLPYGVSRWKTDLSFGTSKIAFSILPTVGWRAEMKNHKGIRKLYDSFSGIFVYDLVSDTTQRICNYGFNPILSPAEEKVLFFESDSTTNIIAFYFNDDSFRTIYSNADISRFAHWQNSRYIISFQHGKRECLQFDLQEQISRIIDLSNKPIPGNGNKNVSMLTKDIPYSKWGVNIRNYIPRSKRKIMKEIILLRGNENYRRALFEEFGSEFDLEDLSAMLEKFESKEESLKGYEKDNFERNSRSTRKIIVKLMEGKKKNEI